MKKQGVFAMVAITAVFTALLIVHFIGRYLNHSAAWGSQAVVDLSTVDTSDLPAGHIIIDINTATLEELTILPGIGQTLAQRIIEYRETHGKFTNTSDIQNVEGIGEKLLEQIREFITVGGYYENSGG